MEVPGLTLWQLNRPVWTVIGNQEDVVVDKNQAARGSGEMEDTGACAVKINLRSFSEFKVSANNFEFPVCTTYFERMFYLFWNATEK